MLRCFTLFSRRRLKTFWSPFTTHCAQSFSGGRSYTTLRSYCDALRDFSFRVEILRHPVAICRIATISLTTFGSALGQSSRMLFYQQKRCIAHLSWCYKFLWYRIFPFSLSFLRRLDVFSLLIFSSVLHFLLCYFSFALYPPYSTITARRWVQARAVVTIHVIVANCRNFLLSGTSSNTVANWTGAFPLFVLGVTCAKLGMFALSASEIPSWPPG